MVDQGRCCALSPAQLDIFLDQSIHEGLPLYSIGGYVALHEAVDTEAFSAAYWEEAERHDALRLRVRVVDGEPQQYTGDDLPTLEQHDFSDMSDPRQTAHDWLQGAFERNFRLTEEPLLRSALVKLGGCEYWYCTVAHHLMIDGWGYGLWIRRLVAAYTARTGRAAEPAPAPAGFLDTMHERLGRPARLGDTDMRASYFESWPEPLLESRSADLGPHESARVARDFDPQRLQTLSDFAAQHGFALHHLLLALVYAYFSALKQRTRLAVGLPMHNRRGAEKAVIGSYVRVNPCLLEADPAAGIGGLMAMVKRAMARSARLRDVSSADAWHAASRRGPRAERLFEVQFNYLKLDYRTDGRHFQTESRYLENRWSQVPFSFNVCEFGEHQPTQLQIDVNEAYFSALEAEQMIVRLDYVADQFLSDPGLSLETLDLVPVQEKQQLTRQWGRAAQGCDSGADIADCFEQVCETHADAIALRTLGERISYRELHDRSRRLAAWLQRNSQSALAPLVIDMKSSPNAIMAMLAAVMLRRPFVPVAPDYPATRLQAIVSDATPEFVLIDADGRETARLLGWTFLDLDDEAFVRELESTDPVLAVPAQDDARPTTQRLGWIIYTSGSTGVPKGVMVPQSAVLRLAHAPNFLSVGPDTVMFQSANIAFDVSTFEIWTTLLNGGTLVMHPHSALDLDSLTDIVETCHVNTLWLTSGLFDKWVGHLRQVPASLTHVMAGGDVVPPAALNKLQRLKPGIVFVNGYGPTENGVFSTCAVVNRLHDPGQPVPIGKPVNGSSVYIVDGRGRLLPYGEAGELWVGGAGVALGYWNQPALTDESFGGPYGTDIPERIYRTGDRVRWRADGQLDYLGRIDQQVKIRGFRIEVEEIEKCLRQLSGVAEAAVVAIGEEASQRHLRACIRPSPEADGDALPDLLAQMLREHLPDYMVPAQFVLVDQIALNANGKIDRERLRQIRTESAVAGRGVDGASPLEGEICELWQASLPTMPSSLDANFYECGGHSLAAMQLLAQINRRYGIALSIADVLKRPSIRQQAELVAQLRDNTQPGATSLRRSHGTAGEHALSFVQEQMWLSHRLNAGSHEYNLPGAFHINGELDRDHLEAALRGLIKRHATLACTLADRDGLPVLRRRGGDGFVLSYRDLVDVDAATRGATVASAMADQRLRSFELETELPLRAELIRLAPQCHLFLLTLHHIAVDGWSLNTLLSELSELYRTRRTGTTAALRRLSLDYHDFAVHQRELAQSGVYDESDAYWCSFLEGAPPSHELPLDAPRPGKPRFRGLSLDAVLETQATQVLEALAAAEGVSLFNLLQTAFALLVGEHSQSRDVVVGTPVSERHDPALYPIVGCFINTLVLRTRYRPEQRLVDLVRENQGHWNEHLGHCRTPFARVLAAVAPAQSHNFNPLFQLWFVLHPHPQAALELVDAQVEPEPQTETNIKFDLMVSATREAEGLRIQWQYAQDLFAPSRMQRMLQAYLEFLRRLPELVQVRLEDLSAQLQWGTAELETPMSHGYDECACIADRIYAHALSTPDEEAVCEGQYRLNYAQLARKTRRLSGLMAEAGVGVGDCVAICADRSVGGVVAMLAIQALGACYLPLDTKLPGERIAFMLADAGADIVLSYSGNSSRLPLTRVELILLDAVQQEDWLEDYDEFAAENALVPSGAAAYLIYTSGSSGQPKGVRVSRANIAHYVASMSERYPLSECRRYAISSAFHTDLGNTTLYLGLWHGAALHLMRAAMMLDGEAVSRYVRDQAIDVMKITPGHFSALCDDGLYEPPVPTRLLIFGGEVLRREFVQAIAGVCAKRGCRVINHYGPTEASIGCITHELDLSDLPAVVPLGLPLPGVRLRVVAGERAVPAGAWGELVIGGPGVSLGYHQSEALNARSFFSEVHGGAVIRFYRTGDRARINAQGRIEFGGRHDDQIKMRGFRIELAEIDAHLLRLPGAMQAITLLHQDEAGQDALVSFVVGAGFDPTAAGATLARSLPDYMLPRQILRLEQMPLLGNGKPHRRALAQRARIRGETYQKPASDSERSIERIVADLLKAPRVSVDQGFFDLGGNSLLINRLANELNLRMNVRISVHLLMDNPSVRSLALMVDALRAKTTRQDADGDIVEIEI